MNDAMMAALEDADEVEVVAPRRSVRIVAQRSRKLRGF